jgi:hypothetical protein
MCAMLELAGDYAFRTRMELFASSISPSGACSTARTTSQTGRLVATPVAASNLKVQSHNAACDASSKYYPTAGSPNPECRCRTPVVRSADFDTCNHAFAADLVNLTSVLYCVLQLIIATATLLSRVLLSWLFFTLDLWLFISLCGSQMAADGWGSMAGTPAWTV